MCDSPLHGGCSLALGACCEGSRVGSHSKREPPGKAMQMQVAGSLAAAPNHVQLPLRPAPEAGFLFLVPDPACSANAAQYQLGDRTPSLPLPMRPAVSHQSEGTGDAGVLGCGDPWPQIPGVLHCPSLRSAPPSVESTLHPDHWLYFPRNMCQGDRSVEKSHPEGLFSKELF